MSKVYPLLPKLAAHRQFIDDFVAATAPCFALGMIEERKQKLGLLTLRPGKSIPLQITEPGFNFGHSLLGDAQFEVVHFAFDFYGFGTYNVLVNPNNLLVQAVLDIMVGTGEYFILVIGPNQGITAFRSDFMLLVHMEPDMHLFKRLLDLSDGSGMNDLCAEYPGLDRFAKLLELIAIGIQSGEFEVPR